MQMDAELMVLSPRVPVRKIKFVRQCQMQQPGKWAVVDVSVDGILEHDGGGVPPVYNARLLPSGCLIEDRNNGCCKVYFHSSLLPRSLKEDVYFFREVNQC